MIKLSELFNISYGNQLDLNKLDLVDVADSEGINFVSRSSSNLGVVCKVKELSNKIPFKRGCITVTLGGEYLLSAYVQQDIFYTAQNIKVLIPKIQMSDTEKKFYCYVIAFNRFRYYSHGREANKTLDELLVPSKDEIPSWVHALKVEELKKDPIISKKINLNLKQWKWFKLLDHFDMFAGKYFNKDSYNMGAIPLVSTSNTNNGIMSYTDLKPTFNFNSITIGKIGVSTFYQDHNFVASPDVTILIPKSNFLNKYNGLFIKTIIEQEKNKWSYGRQIRLGDSKKLLVRLPVNQQGNPDWLFMEEYIKSLSYSSNL